MLALEITYVMVSNQDRDIFNSKICVISVFRFLLAICPEENQFFVPGLCEALSHLYPPKWLVLYISKPYLPLPALHGGTLFRFVLRLWLFRFLHENIWTSDTKMLPSVAELADGLCCQLTVPCFIRGLDDAGEARPFPTMTRMSTIKWKDISRCGSL